MFHEVFGNYFLFIHLVLPSSETKLNCRDWFRNVTTDGSHQKACKS